jgi:linoleoyl-CoA desaturase
MTYKYKIHDKFYDLTDFVKIHPGGTDMFNNLKPNTNITPMVYAYHKNPTAILTILPKYEIPLIEGTIIAYDTNYSYEKYCDLKKLVYAEIQEKKIPLYWSKSEIAYNASMLALYIGLWGYCFYNAAGLSFWWMILLAIMNIGYVALVFHETSHYTGFKNQRINTIFSYLILSPVINSEIWKYEHNYLHHCFTNTDYDADFEHHQFFLRHSDTHQHYLHHRFQYIYAYFLFVLNGLGKGPLTFIEKKRWNILLFVYILYQFGFLNTFVLYGTIGFLFSSIAQLSHIQHECIQVNNENKNDFLYNQVTSSMNYKTENKLVRFICFGLDIQIEHHLFPNLPHSSLRQIQHIVRNYCDKNAIPYIEKPSIFPTIYSYIRYLYTMGNSC